MSFKAYKLQIYPTEKQKVLLRKSFGCKRFVYNKMLAERIHVYSKLKHSKKDLYSYVYKTESEYRLDFPFLCEVSSRLLQQARIDLDKAYTEFFVKRNSFPKYKSKRGLVDSYREPQVHKSLRFMKNSRFNLPKVGSVRYRGVLTKNFHGEIRSVTVSKTKGDKYYVSVLAKQQQEVKPRVSSNNIGIDLGLKEFATLSNGEVISPINIQFTKLEKDLIKKQKLYSRKRKGSKRQWKAKIRLARSYDKLNKKQIHFFWHLANKLCSENKTIKVEDLNVKGMMANRKLSRAIHNISWSKFLTILDQVAKKFMTEIIKIPRFFPSSKLCSSCGNKKEKLSLADRTYECTKCELVIDRDLNAAININNYSSAEPVENSRGEFVRLVKKSFDFRSSSFLRSDEPSVYLCTKR